MIWRRLDHLLDLVGAPAPAPHALRHLLQGILRADRLHGLGDSLAIRLGRDALPHDLDRVALVILLDLFDRGDSLSDVVRLGIRPAFGGLGDFVDQVARLMRGQSRLPWSRSHFRGRFPPPQLRRRAIPRRDPMMLLIWASSAAPATPPPPSCSGLILRGLGVSCPALFLSLLLEQRLTVGDRDLIVVGMNFGKGQEAVAVAAVIHEGRLQRRLDARHLGEIDIAPELLLVGRIRNQIPRRGCPLPRRPGSPPDAPHRSASCLACCMFSAAHAPEGANGCRTRVETEVSARLS